MRPRYVIITQESKEKEERRKDVSSSKSCSFGTPEQQPCTQTTSYRDPPVLMEISQTLRIRIKKK